MAVTVLFRNGFGVDLEVMPCMPVWYWEKDEDPTEDEPGVAVFDGMIINIPFIKIIWGEVYFPTE